MTKIICLLLITSVFSLAGKAQQENLRQSKWVKIMQNDATGNFLEAEMEFRKFYEAYRMQQIKKPDEENNASPVEAHLESQEDLWVASYLKWSMAVRPFVRADGTIIPIEQRIALINETRKKKSK